MFDDICSSVVHSLSDNPFSLMSPLTLSNHIHLGLPLFCLPCTYISIGILFSDVLFSSYTRTSSASYIGLQLAFLPLFVPRSLILSFLIMSIFVTSHIHHSNLFYCSFCNVPAPTLPLTRHVHFLSPKTPQILFQFFQPFCTLRGSSASSSPSSSNVDPR